MKNEEQQPSRGGRPGGLDLSRLSQAELAELKEEIIRRQRPAGSRLEPTMATTDDGSFFFTDDRLAWDDRWVTVIDAISQGVTRIAAAQIAAGSAMASSQMMRAGNDRMAKATLGVAAAAAAGLAGTALRDARRQR
ncbi:MAG TPA: hypothetical protein VF517_02770 [Thermoleophilaceae bacterium]|jgi:hypothetical protein